ncbi:hypothetical protein EC9_38690 [Rosistilla ulvae]|uniref:Uncharacterized protein n=1 Tax=Rosistilla ulvae TaxID=1930277 RepID=A0A517M463_9BACT|nr:hypothetical protein EC9_38690 [Rosistilla ulvae]
MPQQQSQRTDHSPRPNRAAPMSAQGNALGKRRQTNTHKFPRPNGPAPRQPRATPWENAAKQTPTNSQDPTGRPHASPGQRPGKTRPNKRSQPQRGGPNSIAQRHTNDAIDPPRWGSAVNGRVQKPGALHWADIALPTSGRQTDRFSRTTHTFHHRTRHETKHTPIPRTQTTFPLNPKHSVRRSPAHGGDITRETPPRTSSFDGVPVGSRYTASHRRCSIR